MLAVTLLLSVVVGLLRGGRVSSLGAASFAGLPLYAVAFGLQLAVTRWSVDPFVTGCLYVLSFGLLLAGATMDRKTPGVRLIFAGLLSNALVIALNGGKMPVLASAAQVESNRLQAATHVAVGLSGRLAFLGDVLRVSLWGGSLLVSPGDLLLIVGVFVLIQRHMVGDLR